MYFFNSQIKSKKSPHNFNKRNFPHLYGTDKDIYITARNENIYVETISNDSEYIMKCIKNFERHFKK